MSSSDFLQLLFDATIKSTLVLLLVVGLHWLIPKAAAATKHLFLALALAACLCLPLLTLALPTWRIPLLPAPSSGIVKTPRAVPSLVTKASYAPPMEDFAFEQPVLVTSVSEPPSPPLDWTLLVFALWAISAWVVCAQMLVGTVLVWLLKYQARPLANEAWQALLAEASQSLGLTRRVALFASKDAAMPMTTGIFKPIVLLPAEALQWSSAQLKTVLLHELAHIKRYDCLTQLLATLTCTLYWFNPLVWLAARQLRATRELACDDEVLAAGTRASEYASCLVGVAKSVERANYISPIAVGMACSQLEERVHSILNPARRRRVLSRRYVVMIALLIAGLIVPLAGFQPFTQAAPQIQIQKDALQTPEARRAMERAEVEVQQIMEQQRQVLEQELRAAEMQRRALSQAEQQELEQQLRELSAHKEIALHAEINAQQEAELRRAVEEAQRGVEQFHASEAQLRALQQQLQAQQRELSQSELQQKRAELENELQKSRAEMESRRQELSDLRERLQREIERAVREGIETGVSRGVAESLERQIRDSLRLGVAGGVSGGISGGIASGIGNGIGVGIGAGIAEGISKGISDGIAEGVSKEIQRRIERVLDETYRELRSKQHRLEAELQELQKTYKAEHPSVKAKQKELETVKEDLRRFRR